MEQQLPISAQTQCRQQARRGEQPRAERRAQQKASPVTIFYDPLFVDMIVLYSAFIQHRESWDCKTCCIIFDTKTLLATERTEK